MNKLSWELLEEVKFMDHPVGTMALESYEIVLQPDSQCPIELLPDFQRQIDVYSALEHINEKANS